MHAAVGMLNFRIESGRRARVRYFSATTHARNGQLLDEVDISDPSLAATGSNNIIAYRPRIKDSHGRGEGTAAFFINMLGAFPCLQALNIGYSPVCKIFTHEEDVFHGYRVFVEAADRGNDLRVFNTTSDSPTYGFGVQGCPEITRDCFHTTQSNIIVCYLPRAVCI